MKDSAENISRKLHPSKIILPMVIGLSIVGWLLYREWDAKALNILSFSWYMIFFLMIAFVMMAIRDIGYMIRIRVLTENELSWRKAFQVIMLWEFASAVTPSAVGGTTVATFFIWKEGLSAGRSAAVVMATSILDELYFIVMFPLLFILIGNSDMFSIGGEPVLDMSDLLSNQYFYFAAIGYLIKVVFALLLFYGLFFSPVAIKKIFVLVFKLPVLRKWNKSAAKAGDDLISASGLLKNKPFKFWLKAFGATFISWTARYWVVNFLLLALFFGVPDFFLNLYDHFVIFGRQLVMWIMMLVLPSPGGSGFAEWIFQDYLKEFIPVGFVVIMAFMWRLISYYPYLIIGAIVIPRWVKRVFTNKG